MKKRSFVLGALAALQMAFLALAEVPAYDRADWGRWSSTAETGGNGCRWDVRHLLLRDVGTETNVSTLTTREEIGRPCLVLTLTIVDPYTGERHTGPASEVEVDHLVSLAEAHRSGGWAWGPERRRAFWNDSVNLVAVQESVNASKADVDPGGESERGRRESWWPPDESQHCWYGQRWIAVKTKWDLSFDPAEVVALFERTRLCWREPLPPGAACQAALADLAGGLDGDPGLDPGETRLIVTALKSCALDRGGS